MRSDHKPGALSKTIKPTCLFRLCRVFLLVVVSAVTANSQSLDAGTIRGQVLLNASVPIYQGGAEYSRVRQARQTEQQSRKTVDDTRRQVIQQATSPQFG